MKKYLAALAIVGALFVSTLFAQTPPRVYWDHDGVNVTSFDCAIDGGTPVSLGMATLDTGTTYYSNLSNCGTLTNGQHTLVIRACNGTACTAASAIYVVKL